MSQSKFIPELHDIGKLISTELKGQLCLGGKHTFDSFDFARYHLTKPSSPSWWGQFHQLKQEITNEKSAKAATHQAA